MSFHANTSPERGGGPRSGGGAVVAAAYRPAFSAVSNQPHRQGYALPPPRYGEVLSLRAFAASREIFSDAAGRWMGGLDSREAAETRREAFLKALAVAFSVLALFPIPALACVHISRSVQERVQASFERKLAATIEVRGVYKADPTNASNEDDTETGGIFSRKGKLRYRVLNSTAWNICGLYFYPIDGSKGTFYLQRIRKGEYSVVHFESD